MNVTVIIDYHDARARAKRAYALSNAKSHFDPAATAELIVDRMRQAHADLFAAAEVAAVRVHHAVESTRGRSSSENASDDRLLRSGAAARRIEISRMARWRENEKVTTYAREKRVYRSSGSLEWKPKGIVCAVGLDVVAQLARDTCDHVVVLTQQRDFVALAEVVQRRFDGAAVLSFAAWHSANEHNRVPTVPGVTYLSMNASDFSRVPPAP